MQLLLSLKIIINWSRSCLTPWMEGSWQLLKRGAARLMSSSFLKKKLGTNQWENLQFSGLYNILDWMGTLYLIDNKINPNLVTEFPQQLCMQWKNTQINPFRGVSQLPSPQWTLLWSRNVCIPDTASTHSHSYLSETTLSCRSYVHVHTVTTKRIKPKMLQQPNHLFPTEPCWTSPYISLYVPCLTWSQSELSIHSQR